MAPVLLERETDRIAILTLNRPDALNAIDRAMTRALRAAVAEIEADDGIDVFVLAANGERAFCAGVDLKERQRMSDADAARFRADELFPMYRELDRRTKPAVAAVHGHTLAGGFELALACDLIVAADNTSFGLPEVKVGLVPAAGGCSKLPRVLGPALAREMILTGGKLSADEALARGLVNRVVSKGAQVAAALELAGRIGANQQSAVRAAKLCIDNAVDAWAASEFDVEVANRNYGSRGRREGIAGFGAS